jgi:hypothetical protein
MVVDEEEAVAVPKTVSRPSASRTIAPSQPRSQAKTALNHAALGNALEDILGSNEPIEEEKSDKEDVVEGKTSKPKGHKKTATKESTSSKSSGSKAKRKAYAKDDGSDGDYEDEPSKTATSKKSIKGTAAPSTASTSKRKSTSAKAHEEDESVETAPTAQAVKTTAAKSKSKAKEVEPAPIAKASTEKPVSKPKTAAKKSTIDPRKPRMLGKINTSDDDDDLSVFDM